MNDVTSDIITEPLLDEEIALNYSQEMTPIDQINYLVQNLRLTIYNHKYLSIITGSNALDYKKYPFKKNEYTINDYLEGEGAATVDLLRRLNWEKDGITFEKFDISKLTELFSKENATLKNNLQKNTHSISIVTIKDKKFLVDCAYRQFFQPPNEEKQDSEQVNFTKLCLNNEERKKIAEKILKDGWVEATPENIKKYMDMFIEVASDNPKVKFPTEQEYANNFKGEIISGGNILEKKIKDNFIINDKSREYYKNLLSKADESDKPKYRRIRSELCFGEMFFSIIEKKGLYYIKGNIDTPSIVSEKLDENLKNKIYDIQKKAREGELVYSKENLSDYVGGFLKLVSGDKNIKIPQFDLGFLKKIQKDTYVLDIKPDINDSYENNLFSKKMSAKEKLTSIVQKERHFLKNGGRNLDTDSLAGDCEDSTSRVSLDCASKGFSINYLVPSTYLDGEATLHNCTIATLDEKDYLIDCTYRQFFTEKSKENNPRNIYDIR